MLRISIIAGSLLAGAGAASAMVPQTASNEIVVNAASLSVKADSTVVARRGADDRGRDDRGGRGRGTDDRGKDDRGGKGRGSDDRGKDDRGGKGRGTDDGPNHG